MLFWTLLLLILCARQNFGPSPPLSLADHSTMQNKAQNAAPSILFLLLLHYCVALSSVPTFVPPPPPGQLRKNSDIYSFGVILLELITGKPAAAENAQPLVQWVWPIIAQKRPDVDLIVDPQLAGRFVKEVAMVMVIVAKFCVGDSTSRPAIEVVKERLKQALVKQEAVDAEASSG